MNLNFILLNSVGLNLISTISPVDPVYPPLLTNLKSSSSSVRDVYISTSLAKPLPLADDCLAAYTILFKFVTSFNLNITSLVKSVLFGFPVSQWVLKSPSIALSIVELAYLPPLLVIDIIFWLSILNTSL